MRRGIYTTASLVIGVTLLTFMGLWAVSTSQRAPEQGDQAEISQELLDELNTYSDDKPFLFSYRGEGPYVMERYRDGQLAYTVREREEDDLPVVWLMESNLSSYMVIRREDGSCYGQAKTRHPVSLTDTELLSKFERITEVIDDGGYYYNFAMRDCSAVERVLEDAANAGE